MSFSKETIKKVAHLARVDIDQPQVDALSNDLGEIMQMINQLSAADTTNIEPMSHPFDITQRLRHDEVTESDHHVAFQQIAPSTEAGLYLVPKVIE